MKSNYFVKNKQKNEKIKEFNVKISLKKKNKPLIKNNNNNKLLNLPLILEQTSIKNQNQNESIKNRENESFKKSLIIKNDKDDPFKKRQINSNSKRQFLKYNTIKKEYIKKDNHVKKMLSKEKNEIGINNKTNNCKNMPVNVFNKNKNNKIKNEYFIHNSNHDFNKINNFKTINNNSKLDLYPEYHNNSAKHKINKSRPRSHFIINSFNFLNSTEYSSSKAKKLALFNKYSIRENSISNNNKFNDIENDSLNVNNQISLNKNNFKNKVKNKKIYKSSKNLHKKISFFNEVNNKNRKISNELIKQIISLKRKYNNQDLNLKNNTLKRFSKEKKENMQKYISNNRDIFYDKLTHSLRNQYRLKGLYYSNLTNSLDNPKETSTKIFENISDDNEMTNLSILIKSNWGNINKVNFLSISFIDIFNEKIVINNANYDNNKPYLSEFKKGESHILIFYYDKKRKIKNIEIVNGFDDLGIKSIIIENEKKEIIWRGTIPKKKVISNKPYIIILNNIKKFIKKRKQTKNKNSSFDLNTSLFSDKIMSPYKRYSNNTFNNSFKIRNSNRRYIKSKIINNISIKKIEMNETIRKYKKETYEKDSSERNLFNNMCSFINASNIKIPQKSIINPKGKSNIDYQICDKLEIILLINYGNSKNMGLSGIEFYDENESLIDIDSNTNYIKTNQKIQINKQKKLLNNLFNCKNDSTNINNMFFIKNEEAVIEIDFKQKMKIKKIIIYNFNSDVLKNCCVKILCLLFYINKKPEKNMKRIYLNKNLGEEGIEYGQIIKYPFNNCFGIKRFKNLSKEIKNNLLNSDIIYNEEYDYYCPTYPSGFIIKILLLNNWGRNEYIGFEQIQLFDENNNEILLIEDGNNEIISKKEEKIIPDIYLLPENRRLDLKLKPMVLTNYKNKENRIYIIFNNLIMISKINIINYYKYDEIAVKDIKILIDDNVIFEGELNKNLNEIFFSTMKKNEFNKENKEQILKSNKKERYAEKIFENGTKVLSLK